MSEFKFNRHAAGYITLLPNFAADAFADLRDYENVHTFLSAALPYVDIGEDLISATRHASYSFTLRNPGQASLTLMHLRAILSGVCDPVQMHGANIMTDANWDDFDDDTAHVRSTVYHLTPLHTLAIVRDVDANMRCSKYRAVLRTADVTN